MVKLQPSKLIMRVRFPLPAYPEGLPINYIISQLKSDSNNPIQERTKKVKINIKTICTAVILALSISVQADNASAEKIAETVKKSVSAQPKKVIEIVSSQVAQNDSSACEIVKAAIVASNADKDLVAEIVQAATEAAPDKIRIIGQCAVAVAPDAIAEVQTVITKFAAAGGGGAYVLAAPPVAPVNTAPVNPLDFPGQGAVGPTPGRSWWIPAFPSRPSASDGFKTHSRKWKQQGKRDTGGPEFKQNETCQDVTKYNA